MHAAINILKAMEKKFCNFDLEIDYILCGGTVRYPTRDRFSGVHIPIIYGDFFYTEAILKLLGSSFNPW
jgi:unsaturated chondroitin disaccharide hydrolase